MPQQLAVSVENNFTKGLITESIGLNFPENAATDADNCEFTLIGKVNRRLGMDFESNFQTASITRGNSAVNTYKWNNAGGDGSSQLVVSQVGSTLYFYNVAATTVSNPLSANKLAATVDLTPFVVGSFDSSIACEFTDGNGYLFVFHPNIDPVYCVYSGGTITSAVVTVQIRDFVGVLEAGVLDNVRPSSLTDIHKYNLQNQGWSAGNPWSTNSSTTNTYATGAKTFTVSAGLTITAGQSFSARGYVIDAFGRIDDSQYCILSGTVTSYAGSTLVLSVTGSTIVGGTASFSVWTITAVDSGYINTWFTAVGNYPSNADQWWRFKNSSGSFSPGTTQANTSIGAGAAPKGHYILNAFTQSRATSSAISTITDITTSVRPTNGCWFQGRVWYTGVNSSFSATGNASFTTWTENIYFSQVVNNISDFGKCYQINDPTSELLFDLLPTDGGVIVIQGSGPIYKLFPTQNGLIVFAANGVWYITGSQGIGFSATDYTITKISSVKSISTTSYVDVLGMPYFWNEEGIYKVSVQQNGSLSVDAITFDTILTYYESIPLSSKKKVRGAYSNVDYTIHWVYRSTEGVSVSDKYSFDKSLVYNIINKAFFPYTFNNTSASINSICYVDGPGGTNTPPPTYKYFATTDNTATFAEIYDDSYVDWASTSIPVNYTSYFITGFKLRGQAVKKFQQQYVQVWADTYSTDSGYKIQGLWDYSVNRNSNRFTTIQNIPIDGTDYLSMVKRRHKIRGNGFALQLKFISQDGLPFTIVGWAIVDTVNAGT